MSWELPSLSKFVATVKIQQNIQAKSAPKRIGNSNRISSTTINVIEDPLTKKKREQLETERRSYQEKLKIVGRELYSDDINAEVQAREYLAKVRELTDQISILKSHGISALSSANNSNQSSMKPVLYSRPGPRRMGGPDSRIPLVDPISLLRGDKRKEAIQKQKEDDERKKKEEKKKQDEQDKDTQMLRKLRGREVRRQLNAMARGHKYQPLSIDQLKQEVEDIKSGCAGRDVRQRRDDYSEDDEYDADMDDWLVDDGDEGGRDSSDWQKELRKITGYDPRKWAGKPVEEVEEASYNDQMREEARSRKIARMEEKAIEEEEDRLKKAKKARMSN